MLARLFLLFTLVPLLELFLLLQLGRVLGFGATLLLVVTTGILGAWFARTEGMRVVRQWQAALAQGRVPDEGILGGVLVLVGGVLLVTPGVLTDALGLALLIPPSRRLIAAFVRRRVERGMAEGSIRVVTWQGGPGPNRPPRDRDPNVMEGRVVSEEDVTPPPSLP